MNCPNCGADIPEGELTCPVCGSSATDAQPVNMTSTAAPAPKSNKGVIIGVVAALVAIAAIVVVLVVFVFGGSKPDGHYVCDDMSFGGIEMALDINGDKATMSMTMEFDVDGNGEIDPETESESETQEGTVSIDGDKMTLTFDGESMVATYNKKEKTIVLDGEEMGGMTLTFTKE